MRELARLSFLSLQTVQDELAKLQAAALIQSRSDGYHRFYSPNSKHPLYDASPDGNQGRVAAQTDRTQAPGPIRLTS